jgi:hypothetical protein
MWGTSGSSDLAGGSQRSGKADGKTLSQFAPGDYLIKRSVSLKYSIAIVYAGLGDKDQAFAWVERAFSECSGHLTWLTTDPQLDGLRSDPRFADLVRRVGLPQ